LTFVRLVLGASLTGVEAPDESVKSGTQDMAYIEGGTFQMGDVFDEGVRFATPVHEVTVSSFYLNKYEVTVEGFTAFVKDALYVTSAEKDSKDATRKNDQYSMTLGSRGAHVLDPAAGRMLWVPEANWKNPQYEQTPKDPVACVSWTDAVSYCNWLSAREGLPIAYDVETGDLLDAQGRPTADVTKVRGYRLPTEAEWEYAARERGRKVRFGNGQDIARPSEMNFNASDGEFVFVEKGEFRKKTIPVGSFRPNSLGLYDMSGNVWEWCSDFMGQYSKQPQANPYQQKGMMGPRRAARDGPWAGDASWARTSARMGWVADDRCNMIGFRVARSR
jgi:formylglycine-generating enzyme required for sulfatase activity